MSLKQQLVAADFEWRQFDHDDESGFVVDFGPEEHSSADVVGDTVIVVTGGEQYEFDIDGDAQVSMKNGVLTVEVDR